MGKRKRMNTSGTKPQIERVTVNGRTRYLGITDAAKWISAKHGVKCTTQSVINAISRRGEVRPKTAADFVREEYPEIFGIAK